MMSTIQHRVSLYAQPTDMSCWSAAVSMLLENQCVGAGKAVLNDKGGLGAEEKNIQLFAKSYGLRLYFPQTWTVEGLVMLLERGPVAMLGAMPNLHTIVIGGIKGNGTPEGTELTIYDPWPPKIGRISLVNYEQLMKQFPFSTIYMLQK